MTDPVSVYAAVTLASAAAGAAGQASAARSQQISEQASIDLQTAQTKTQAARTARDSASNFRRSLAAQIALADHRGGAGSLTRQLGTEAFSSFLEDQQAIRRGVRINDIKALNLRADAAARKHLSDVKTFSGLASTTLKTVGGLGDAKGWWD